MRDNFAYMHTKLYDGVTLQQQMRTEANKQNKKRARPNTAPPASIATDLDASGRRGRSAATP